jgi:succinate-semialdehyde dehydrogenase / glutarate-semialdehyde dehydrogenase
MGSIAQTSDAARVPIPIKNTALFDSQGLIAGTWKNATNNKSFPVYEPSSGEILAECSDFGTTDFEEAIHAAHIGFKEFSTTTTAKERATLLRKWYELIIENLDDCR